MIEVDKVEEKLRKVFVEVFSIGAANIDRNTRQNEFPAWDSLGQLRIIMAVEEAFGISFGIEEIPELNTFGRIMDAVISKSGI